MRSRWCALLAALSVLLLAPDALAHGGGGFRGFAGGVPPGLREPSAPTPPPLPCWCAKITCAKCFGEALATGDRRVSRKLSRTGLQRWNDFQALRITLTYRARDRAVEAHSLIAPSALFALTAGQVAQGDSTLTASLRPSGDARTDYMKIRQRGLDPLLLTRRGPGTYDLRVFPVRTDADTVVVLGGVALAPARERGKARLYRSGDRILVVRDLAPNAKGAAGEFVDEPGRRALAFLTLDEARRRYGRRVKAAVSFPDVDALACAVTGKGEAAVSGETDLVAVEAQPQTPDSTPDPTGQTAGPPPPEDPGASRRRVRTT